MADVGKEDVIALTYLPDSGVTVTVKGKDAAVIPGADFQQVLFSIWLEPTRQTSRSVGLFGRAGSTGALRRQERFEDLPAPPCSQDPSLKAALRRAACLVDASGGTRQAGDRDLGVGSLGSCRAARR